ncbi:hypothetical protein DTO166G4_6835 [Paecilomyces variotii]|nr:hypothetical protein DTO166G4_6835 [Paecilomyces variotii]KAJ9232953.1 hypothetical protein DTO166G5_5965 [Paecilomyces variotii]KAJ9235641.1 hypothetical protein DTO169E5_6096 [Paecilomyces variotii]KAJ9384482.1 hypothetical protein DTO063F5_4786 [Paecilomyces variotii]
MDDILAPLQNALEGQIDFHGQRLAEILSTVLLILSGVVAFIAGFVSRDVYLTLWVGLAGTLLTALVVIPPWPVYNKHPEKWLVPSGVTAGGPAIIVERAKAA